MKLAVVGLTIALAGCATTRSDPAVVYRDESQALTDHCRKAFQSPALDSIREKVPVLLGLSQPTLALMSDQSVATDEQRPAILTLDATAIECSNRRMELTGKYFGSEYVAVERAASSDAQRNRLDLYLGKISWGQYVGKANAISDDARGMFAALDQRRRQLGIQQQSANAQSLGAAAAMMQATTPVIQPIQPLTLQPLPQLPRPINCTSVRQGAFTNTHCQ